MSLSATAHQKLNGFILLISAVIAGSSMAATQVGYNWKPGDVLRYEFSKVISIIEKSEDKDPGKRTISFDAVLILEVLGKAPSGGGNLGVLRFESPHIDIPDVYTYYSTSNETILQKDRGKALERSIEGAVKVMRWSVLLGEDGKFRIDARFPKTLDEIFRDTQHVGIWKAKYVKAWQDIVENSLGLKVSDEDREIFFSFAPPAVNANAAPVTGLAPEYDKIRPYRSAPVELVRDDERIAYQFTRVAPPKAGQPYCIPFLNKPKIEMKLNPKIATKSGDAVVDNALGLLDSLTENYTFEIDYQCVVDTNRTYKMNQEVNVKYELKRLAPPFR